MEPRCLRTARRDGRLHREQHAVRPPEGRVRRRRHLRDELRVRLRLPPRQHVDQPRRSRATRAHLRDRGRGRLDPRRRGAHTADHLRRADDRGAHLLRLRAHRQGPRGRAVEGHEARRRRAREPVRLPLRREAQDDLADRVRDREGRAGRQDRQPLQPRERPARQPPDPGAQGAGALQARRRLRRAGRRGEDRRRVHGSHHGGAPLERGPAPGGRGEGERRDPGGAPDARDDHVAELLPSLREARWDDGYREDRGEGVRRDLRPERRRDPDQRRGRARRQERPDLQDRRGEVQRCCPGRQGAAREGPARAGRHHCRRDVRVSERAAQAPGCAAHRAEREGARARGGDHQGRRLGRRRHDRDEHGRPRRRHQDRRHRARAGRPLCARHRAPRGAPHRQPAPRPVGPPGGSGRDPLLPLRSRRPRAAVRRRPDPQHHGALQAPRRPADGSRHPFAPDRERAEEGRGAELRPAQERPQVRRRDERPAAW